MSTVTISGAMNNTNTKSSNSMLIAKENAAIERAQNLMDKFRLILEKDTSFTGRDVFMDMAKAMYFSLAEKARMDTLAQNADLEVMSRLFQQ
jgi:hypothetical protein